MFGKEKTLKTTCKHLNSIKISERDWVIIADTNLVSFRADDDAPFSYSLVGWKMLIYANFLML